jgi:hypothetical protein
MSAPGVNNAQTELRVTIRRYAGWHLKKSRRASGPGSYYREGQYDCGNSLAVAEENQIEQQHQLNFNKSRTIGTRGNDHRQQVGPSRDRVYHQQLRCRNGDYNHNTEEEHDYFEHFCCRLLQKFEAYLDTGKAPYLEVFRQLVNQVRDDTSGRVPLWPTSILWCMYHHHAAQHSRPCRHRRPGAVPRRYLRRASRRPPTTSTVLHHHRLAFEHQISSAQTPEYHHWR